MPTYQYRCKNCRHELEAVQAFTDDPLEVCPACQGELRKVYGSVGISFKGSGFYKNDARKGGSSKSTSSTSSSTTGSDSSSSTSTSSASDSGSSSGTSSTPAAAAASD